MNQLRLLNTEIFVPSPEPGTTVTGGAYYTRSVGAEMMSIHTYSSRSDILSHEYYRRSEDNGATWSEATMVPAGGDTEYGMLRRHARGAYLDPGSGRFILIRNQAILPTDNVSEFMTHNAVYYSISLDGGHTFVEDGPVVAEGPEYDADHPLPNVTIGKNCFMLGDRTCMPITLPDGTILQPVQISPTGPDGAYRNPGAGFTYTDCAVLRGRWRDDSTISWSLGGMVYGDPDRSTRGLIEPTIARLPDGRILMVMRGSNDVRPHFPGYRWFSISGDDGATWSAAEPWSYDTGTRFFSPSSCSQLISHSNGEIYWIGNICETNPKGNEPRYPIIVGRVDGKNAGLIEDSILIIDDRKPTDDVVLTMSNFYAQEDRFAHTIKLYLCRHSRNDRDLPLNPDTYQGDCLLYEIAVG